MKNILLILFIFLSSLVIAGTPAKIIRVALSTEQFGDNVSKGNIIVNTGTGKSYTVLLSLASTKTIATCSTSEISEIVYLRGGSLTDAFLLKGTFIGGPEIGLTAGPQMFWSPRAAAFRAGLITGTEWNITNIGNYSFASGYNTKANFDCAAAFGENTRASEFSAFASGTNTLANGMYSFAANYATNANSAFSTAFGFYNVGGGTAEPYPGTETDPLFEIGNGTDDTHRASAFRMLRNGYTTFSDTVKAKAIIKTGGLSTQFLMANGTTTVAVPTNLSTSISSDYVRVYSSTGEVSGYAHIASADATYAGILTSADKIKLNGIATGATNFTNASETDPTIWNWAKASSKPSYTPSEVGAEPALGNPVTTGYVLASTDAGVRSWVANGSSKWQQLTGLIAPATIADKVLIGSTTSHTSDIFQVTGSQLIYGDGSLNQYHITAESVPSFYALNLYNTSSSATIGNNSTTTLSFSNPVATSVSINTGFITNIVTDITAGAIKSEFRWSLVNDSFGEKMRLNHLGNLILGGSVRVSADTEMATVSNVGAIRYRSDANNSYCEMVMRTGASTYAWVIIKQNTW